MNAVQIAMQNLDAAVAHRARIGAELTPHSRSLLVQWYEDALEAEGLARIALRDAIATRDAVLDRESCRA